MHGPTGEAVVVLFCFFEGGEDGGHGVPEGAHVAGDEGVFFHPAVFGEGDGLDVEAGEDLEEVVVVGGGGEEGVGGADFFFPGLD